MGQDVALHFLEDLDSDVSNHGSQFKSDQVN
jgi:hypothetical protein